MTKVESSFLTDQYIKETMEVTVRVKKAELEKCETLLDVIELVSGEWLKQHHPPKRK